MWCVQSFEIFGGLKGLAARISAGQISVGESSDFGGRALKFSVV